MGRQITNRFVVVVCVLSMAACTTRTKGGKAPEKPVELPRKLKSAKRDVALPKEKIIIPFYAAYRIAVRPWQLHEVFRDRGHTIERLRTYPGILSETPIVRPIWEDLRSGRVSGVDTTRAIQAAFFFGSLRPWEKHAKSIYTWSTALWQDRTERTLNPVTTKDVAKAAGIARGLTWFRHRVIIPLAKPALFAHLLKRRFPGGAITCPLGEKLSERPDLVRHWHRDEVREVCGPSIKSAGLSTLPDMIVVDQRYGTIASLRIFTTHARLDFLEAPRNRLPLEFTVPGALKAMEASFTKELGEAPPPMEEEALSIDLSFPYLFWSMYYVATASLLRMVLNPPGEGTPKKFFSLMQMASDMARFATKATFMADGSRVVLQPREKKLVLIWGLKELGKKLLAPLASQNGVTLTRAKIVALVTGWLTYYKGLGPDAEKRHGKLMEALSGCGVFCTTDCLNRLSLECLLTDLKRSPKSLVADLEAYIRKLFPKLAPRMGTMVAKVTEDMLTIEVKVK